MIKPLTSDQIVSELDMRGVRGRITSGGNYSMCCPFHHEKNPSLVVSLRDHIVNKVGLFYCNGCNRGGNIFQLLAKIDGVHIREILKRFSIDENDYGVLADFFSTMLKAMLTRERIEPSYIKISDVKYSKLKKPFGRFRKYLLGPDRKFTEASIENFDLRVSVKDERIYFPYKDINGKILTVKKRSIKKNIERKYKVLSHEGTDPKPCLFGIYQLRKRWPSTKTCVLVEGESDAIYLQQFGIPAVALGNTSISPKQFKQLCREFETCYLCLDGDMRESEEKRATLKRLKEKISMVMPVINIMLPMEKDPNNLSKSEVNRFFPKWRAKKAA